MSSCINIFVIYLFKSERTRTPVSAQTTNQSRTMYPFLCYALIQLLSGPAHRTKSTCNNAFRKYYKPLRRRETATATHELVHPGTMRRLMNVPASKKNGFNQFESSLYIFTNPHTHSAEVPTAFCIQVGACSVALLKNSAIAGLLRMAGAGTRRHTFGASTS